MFHSAALKLTLWYLAIIMAISLIFSMTLYRVSSEDLDRSVNRQIGYFNNLLGPDESTNYRRLRSNLLSQDLDHLKANLFLFNLLVLAGGGAASYWLARRTLQPIELALESQTRFASDASHELRTPLTAMITENEVALRNKNLSKSGAIGVIKSNVEEAVKLKSLAEGLLRLTNGRGEIENPQPVNLNFVVEAAVGRYASTAKANGISLQDRIGNLSVSGDQDSLVELISIFIDNAIKYSSKGSRVTLNAKSVHKNVHLTIADSGTGIKPDDLPRIFERFYRADADNSRHKDSEGGYGLGLSIAKKIAEAHHGHIEVASKPGKGTTFTIILPAA